MNKEEAKWILSVLRNVKFFSTFTIADIDSLLDLFIRYSFPSGKRIIKEGNEGEAFYVVYRGTVSVRMKSFLWFSKQLAELGEGMFFGEMSLLSNDPANATIIARGPVELYALPRRDFQKVVAANKDLSDKISYIAETRKLEAQLYL